MRCLVFLFVLFETFTGFSQRNGKPYEEDLSVIRPKFPELVDTVFKNDYSNQARPVVTPFMTVNEKVNAVLDSIDKLNVLRKFVDGFTIQIYSGQNREDANNAKLKMTEEFGYLKADLQYLQPKFRVKTGSYFTRLDAQPDLLRVRRIFPNAILVPERILIK